MKVRFDLRPAGLIEKERQKKKFNFMKVIAVFLMGMFFLASGGYIVVMTLNLLMLRDEVQTRENLVSGLDMERANLNRQVTELRAQERVFIETLRIMNEDMPTIEVLNALESNMDIYGIGFNTLKFTQGREARGVKEPDMVELTGLVASDKQIVDYSDRLRTSGVFNDVRLPVTTLNERTGMISYTLQMPVKEIGDINKP
ncbi:MAG: hypothetical protein FWG71_05110 [Synergistaceae bacterium]|nr:hypothetical protein [Synergistaceae bacterium]